MLKYLAIVAMVVDHTAYLFVPADSPVNDVMRLIGRLSCPIICFFIAEGFRHTRCRRRYLLRMAVFAVISQPAYWIMVGGALQLNVMYTLSVALVMLMALESQRFHVAVKAVLVAGCFGLSLTGDWSWIIPACVLLFYTVRHGSVRQFVLFCMIAALASLWCGWWLQLAMLLALIPLSLYNGERGGSEKYKNVNTWAFYWFYPVHVMILVAIKIILEVS